MLLVFFSLLIIVSSELIFISSLIKNPNLLLNLFGFIHLASFLTSSILLVLYFRKQGENSDYKLAFSVFGILIVTAIPTLVYIIPGIVFYMTGITTIQWIGWALSFVLFIAFMIGIFYGRWNWKVHKIELEFPDLPEDFDLIKIVQISDIHVGSFFKNYDKVKKAIQKINDLNPHYVLFTGDLVNNTVEEFYGWENIFLEIQAHKGKFSILGNHDYGDYVKWKSNEHQQRNLSELIEMHRKIGFTPLLNQAIELTSGFWLLGVENWGKAPFRQNGKLDEALKNVPDNHFKLLLSHDPSHFDEQVIHTNINLTLSGHTHGMQFGIERFGIKWSPVSWRYKKWAGLYKQGNQFLYVNRGFGYIGFPGRVGIYPEITEITLRKKYF